MKQQSLILKRIDLRNSLLAKGLITKLSQQGLIWAIDFYRNYISRLMLPRCRFFPTCSAYAREAIEKKGLAKGLWLSLRRLGHCHPFSRAEFYDPVE